MDAPQEYVEVFQKDSAQRIGLILDQLDKIRDNLVVVNTENFSQYDDARDLNGSLSIIASGLQAFALTTAMAAALSESKSEG
jgi:hypothetical protein